MPPAGSTALVTSASSPPSGAATAPRFAAWICSYTRVRSSAKRGVTRVVNWSRSRGRSTVSCSWTTVGDLDSTITRSPR